MGRGRVPSEKTTRLDTPAGGRRPCPPRRNPAAGPGADGLGVRPETGHRREPEPHHQTQNQPVGHPHRRPGDQPAGRPRRRPSDRRDGTPPADPGQPAGRPRRRPGIGRGRVPPPAPGPTGWVPLRRPRPPRRNPTTGPGPDRLGVPRRRPGAEPGRNPLARPGTDDRLGDPGRRPPGAGRDGTPPPDPGPTGWVSPAGGLRCCGWASCARWGHRTRHVMRGVRCRSGQGMPRRRRFSRRRGAQPRRRNPAVPNRHRRRAACLDRPAEPKRTGTRKP